MKFNNKYDRLISLLNLALIMKNNSNLQIILHKTSHPGNIGAAARAMKTMDIENLCLVQPKSFPDSIAYARSSGAVDILDNASICQELEQALATNQLVFAASARSRQLSLPVLKPQAAAIEINNALNNGTKVAVLFGNEQHGLSNEHLQKCHKQIIIPTSNIYGSLNLAAAVQIICYEIYSQSSEAAPNEQTQDIATAAEFELLFQHMLNTLEKIDYIKPQRSSKIAQKLKILLQQYQLSHEQVQIIRGVLTQIEKSSSKENHES